MGIYTKIADNGGKWVQIGADAAVAAPAVISGHNGATVETGKVIDGKTYDVYTFTDDTATDLSLTVETAGFVDMLLVAGGGGCGNDAGGGGGGLFHETVLLPDVTHPVVVGSGGAGASSGLPGGYSRLGSWATPGGGAGQNASNLNSYGGSAGGGGRNLPGSPWQYGIALYGGTYGNNAAGGTSNPISGGGGGGAGAPSVSSEGGAGLFININGINVEYARGGDGLSHPNYNTPIDVTKANTGHGANGGAQNGASGIVIVRVEV